MKRKVSAKDRLKRFERRVPYCPECWRKSYEYVELGPDRVTTVTLDLSDGPKEFKTVWNKCPQCGGEIDKSYFDSLKVWL